MSSELRHILELLFPPHQDLNIFISPRTVMCTTWLIAPAADPCLLGLWFASPCQRQPFLPHWAWDLSKGTVYHIPGPPVFFIPLNGPNPFFWVQAGLASMSPSSPYPIFKQSPDLAIQFPAFLPVMINCQVSYLRHPERPEKFFPNSFSRLHYNLWPQRSREARRVQLWHTLLDSVIQGIVACISDFIANLPSSLK